ncbi:MAG: hypothetical protein PUF62_12140, partial [Bacteroidales bacterium]|nr:hypothetical protein [Bacteroidales bacterium]
IYLTFSAESPQTFTMRFRTFTLGAGEYFEYAVGDGNWTQFTSKVSNIPFGGTLGNLRLRGKSSQGTANNIGNDEYSSISFGNASVEVSCRGDIRTLVDYEHYETTSTANARFARLFYNCTSLTTAPALPATTLADFCYCFMFYNCTSLTTAPALPATEMKNSCYQDMFELCTALTTAPALPATTLVTGCYHAMFYNCTALTTAPELPATTLATYCYCFMFSGCSKLSEVKMLATNVSATDCLLYWLTDAGTSATSRTLTLSSLSIYNEIKGDADYLPNNWKTDQATIQYTNP